MLAVLEKSNQSQFCFACQIIKVFERSLLLALNHFKDLNFILTLTYLADIFDALPKSSVCQMQEEVNVIEAKEKNECFSKVKL